MAKLAVKLSSDNIGELRKIIKGKEAFKTRMAQAIILVDKKESEENIKLVTGMGRSRAFELRKQYLQKGKIIFAIKQRGVKELLTKTQLAEIIEIVKTKTPQEIGYNSNYEFWNTGILARYIEDIYNVKYKSKTSYYLIFKKSFFTYHKPGHIYQKHDSQKVISWRQETLPKLKMAWKDPGTVILCEDEMKLSTQTTFQKIWLPKGEYPKVVVSNKKEGRSIYGFLNIKTGTQHAFKTSWQNMFITKDQLVKIRQIYQDKKLVIFWDGPGSHKGHIVSDYVKTDGNIEIIYFPPYSPAENPQEHVWKQGRSQITHNKYIENIDTTTDLLVEYLNTTKFTYKLLEFKSDLEM